MNEYVEKLVAERHKQIVEYIESEFGLLPEGKGGLFSLLENDEDVTCAAIKKVAGRRDKNWGSHG